MARQDYDKDGDFDINDQVLEVAQGVKGAVIAYRDVSKTITSLERGKLPGIGLRSMFGLGRLQLVPTDEIHVVVGYGWHISKINTSPTVFGRPYKDPEGKTVAIKSVYPLNKLTEVTRLVTTSFEVPVPDIPVLDKNNVAFTMDAFCQAALNPAKAEIAAERVGGTIATFISSLAQIAASAIIQAAATMTLNEIIAKRSDLEDKANDAVERHLANLGYQLIVLTVSNIYGDAVTLKTKQALAETARDATIKTNAALVAQSENDAETAIRNAQIASQQDEKTAETKRLAQLKIDEGTQATSLTLLQLRQEKASATSTAELKEIELQQQANLAEEVSKAAVAQKQAENQAAIAALQAERAAALAAEQQKRDAELALRITESGAEVANLEQERQLARLAAKEKADVDRDTQKRTAEAQTTSNVKLIVAQSEADALLKQAEAEAAAAQKEAQGAEAKAAAQIRMADAERAQKAATGIAEAEVAERKALAAIEEAKAVEAKGLAEAAVRKAMEQVAIDIQTQMAILFAEHPEMVDLERLRIQNTHQLELARVQSQMFIAVIQALAGNMDIRIIGNGGQMGQMLQQLFMFNANAQEAVKEVPWLSNLLGTNNGTGLISNLPAALSTVMSSVDPSVLGNLSIADLLQRVAEVQSGDKTLAQALEALHKDGNFQLIANLPVLNIAKVLMTPKAEVVNSTVS